MLVYLLKTRDLEEYKIGFTKGDIKKRLKSLQTGCPSEIVVVDSFESEFATKIESTLHFMWGRFRVNGEWFLFENNEQLKFNELCQQFHNNFQALKAYQTEYNFEL